MSAGGMSFEQRKRVSIGVELAANPSILFLDEPTTGLDSKAAQSLIRNLRTIADSGRSIVCTIHQPSSEIFTSFDALLLLRRGGQTVYFGQLGEECCDLIKFFESAPGVTPMPCNTNPATWMLGVIGAGTSEQNPKATKDGVVTDFHAYYQNSSLQQVNATHLDTLTVPNEGSKKLDDIDFMDNGGFNAPYWLQFWLLLKRIALTYWRTPTSTLSRPVTNLLIALIFGSAYPQQKYTNYVATVSRAAVIYITSLFCGVLASILVVPVVSQQRPVFYREQQSRMYSVSIYCLTMVLIEVSGKAAVI
jgi:energy-coupling factor transporter ATP-binding protein EcfA2